MSLGKSMNCVVCRKPAIPRSPCCPRCRPLIVGHAESRKRRIALRAAYGARLDVFRCWWSGAMLVLDDPTDPFHLCFDRFSPQTDSPLAASSRLFRSLRAGLDSIDFPNASRELAAHHRGRPFDREAVTFEWWTERMPPPRAGPLPRPAGRGRGCGADTSKRERRANAMFSYCITIYKSMSI